MATIKYIYWRSDVSANEKGEPFANVHLLVGYNQGTIADFQKMAAELRETFPQATDDQIEGGKVAKSSRVQGFTIVTWNAHIPKGEYPGWQQVNSNFAEYRW